jgi:hypothetical protein
MRVISSQRYRDESIVEDKREALACSDATTVTLPVLPVGAEHPDLYILMDGHHTHSAAVALGLAIAYRVLERSEHDLAGLSGEALLQAAHLGDDYYDVATGADVF